MLDHPRRRLDRIRQQRRVDPAFETLARIADDLVPPPGECHRNGLEQRAFQEHARRALVAPRRLATHHAGERLHAIGIRDHAVILRHGVVLAVQGLERLPRARPEHQPPAGHLVGIEHVQRPAEIHGEEIRHVHQRVDRPQPHRHQPLLQPFRARPVLHPANGPAQHPGAGQRHLDRPIHRTRAMALHLGRRERHQRAQPGRRQIPRHATHRKRIAAVRRHGNLDHRIIQPRPLGIGHAHGCGLIQFHDPRMVLAQPHLPVRQQHPGTFHTADLAHLQRDRRARNVAARRREHALHAGARIRRPAHHGDDAVAGVHLARPQPIGIRVLHRFHHMRHHERRQRRPAILHALQLQPDIGQRRGDLIETSLGLQMRLQPGKGELHGLTPPRGASPAPGH